MTANNTSIVVQELAKLTLKAPCTTETQELLTHLRTAIATLNKASGHSFHLFHQVEDDRTFYLSGQWDSTEAHQVFLLSPENQHLLSIFEPYVQVEWMFHILQEGDALLDGSVPWLSVAILNIPAAKVSEFETTYRRVQPNLQRWTLQKRLAAGWVAESRGKADKGGEAQFVVLSPWQDLSGLDAFGNSEDFERYSPPLQGLLSSADVKQVTPWEI